jgi:TonB family protein
LPAAELRAKTVEPEPAAREIVAPGDSGPRVSADRTGVLDTKDAGTLRLTSDLGSVKIIPLQPGAPPVVRYSVHIETDARTPLAQRLLDRYSLIARNLSDGVQIVGKLPPELARSSSTAQLWVRFEITVPGGYSVEVHTGGGDIDTRDIGGTALLSTQGGNIRVGRIGVGGVSRMAPGRLLAKLETEGGHIHVLDVAGALNAFTAGGHINVGSVAGDASLRSGGGHIRAGKIAGRADLQTDGGNITVGQAENLVSVRTGGGQIDFGEVRGSVRALTGGGGIRIMYVSGPLEVESSAGSICLTRVAGKVQAATAGGTIRAWINPEVAFSGGPVHLAGASQLSSGNGDIVVFLPRNLAADIDAWVAAGGQQRIEADPSLALTFETPTIRSGPVHAVAALNGGGAPLKLRTNSGKIRLRFIDSEIPLRDSLMREQRERLMEYLSNVPFTPPAFDDREGFKPPEPPRSDGDWVDSLMNRVEIAFTGKMRQDPDEFKKRVISSPRPVYPDIAKRAGVEGMVRLQVRATKDGRVEVVKVLEGSPALADAAIAAANQWRVKPVSMGGRPIEVVSIVSFDFHLH